MDAGHLLVSVSKLEAFRLFRAEAIPEDEFLATLRGEFAGNERTVRGQSIHSFIETGFSLNHRIHWPSVAEALEPEDRAGTPEVWISDDLGPDHITARVDALNGLSIREFKTTKQFHIERYLDSCQWRFYLLLSGAWEVVYRVFELTDGKPPHAVREAHTFSVVGYPALESDCLAHVDEFRTWCRFNAGKLEGAKLWEPRV